MTTIENKCIILGDVWIRYRTHEAFEQFVRYSDLALPLAYSISGDIVSMTPKAQMYIEESWLMLLDALEIEDEGFEDLEEMFDSAD